MIIENLGDGNGVDESGDVVSLFDLAPDQSDDLPTNAETIHRQELDRRLEGRDIVSLGAAAAIAMERQQVQYPRRIEDVIAERKAAPRSEDRWNDRDDAYASLGGGVPAYRDSADSTPPLDNVIDEYEPWKHELRQAVEQFGVVDFSASELARMKDFGIYSLHFYRFMDGISTTIRLIGDVNGQIGVDQDLRRKYGDRSIEEANKYVDTLKWLKSDLEKTGIPRAARRALGLDPEGRIARGDRVKTLGVFQEDRRKHRLKNVRVLRKNNALHIERTDQVFNK